MLRPVLFFKRRLRKLFTLLLCSFIGVTVLSVVSMLVDAILSGYWECYIHFEHLSVWSSVQPGIVIDDQDLIALKNAPNVVSIMRGQERWFNRKLPFGTERAFLYEVYIFDLSLLAHHLGYTLQVGRWPHRDDEIIVSSKAAKAYGLGLGSQVVIRNGSLWLSPSGLKVSGVMEGPGFLALRGIHSKPEGLILILVKDGNLTLTHQTLSKKIMPLWTWYKVKEELRRKTSFLRWVFFCLSLAIGLPITGLASLTVFLTIREYASELAILRVIGLASRYIYLRTLAGFILPISLGSLIGMATGLTTGVLLVERLSMGTGVSPGIDPVTAMAVPLFYLALIIVAAVVVWKIIMGNDPITTIEAGREVLGDV